MTTVEALAMQRKGEESDAMHDRFLRNARLYDLLKFSTELQRLLGEIKRFELNYPSPEGVPSVDVEAVWSLYLPSLQTSRILYAELDAQLHSILPPPSTNEHMAIEYMAGVLDLEISA